MLIDELLDRLVEADNGCETSVDGFCVPKWKREMQNLFFILFFYDSILINVKLRKVREPFDTFSKKCEQEV